MPLGLFNRRRKGSLIQPPREVETITLRVLVDSGPTARDMFVIRVPVDDHVGAIRNAIAAQIGIPSMCLFKVSHYCMLHGRHNIFRDTKDTNFAFAEFHRSGDHTFLLYMSHSRAITANACNKEKKSGD
jgi:hypothetical protein